MGMDKHFLQSESWEKFQLALSKQVFRESGKNWEFMAVLERTFMGNYLYLPYGPILRNKNAFKGCWQALERLGRAKDVMFIRIEPTIDFEVTEMAGMGFKKTGGLNPEHTWVVNLTASREDILKQMKQNNRNVFNNYAKKGIVVNNTTSPEKINNLTSLLARVAKENGINVHSTEYFRKQMETGAAKLYWAEFENKPIAAALVYDSPTVRYYAHAAADYEHRKLAAGTALVAQMMMDAKRDGQKEFDFYGVTTSDNPNHPWQGFSKFKRSFGGSLRTYAGTWDFPLKKARYSLFRFFRAINRWRRKVF